MKHILQIKPYNQSRIDTGTYQIVDDPNVIKESYADYLQDESRFKGYADCVMFPESEQDILDIVRHAKEHGLPVTISSARTGISGGAVPQGGALCSLERMNRILDVNWDEENACWRLSCQPGISLEYLDRTLRGMEKPNCSDNVLDSKFWKESGNWFYPPDPTEKTAHLGGTVATNASGSRSYHFGPTRNFITRLKVVLSNGWLLELKRGEAIIQTGDIVQIEHADESIQVAIPEFKMPDIKHAAGYYLKSPMDLIDLFIGSEGTLGIITEVEIQLRLRPESMLGALVFFKSDEAAHRFVNTLKQSEEEAIVPTAIEYFDQNALKLLRMVKKESPASTIRAFPESAMAAIYVEKDSAEEASENCLIAYDALLSGWDKEIIDTWAGTETHELEAMSEFRHAVPEAINSKIGQRQRDIPGLHKIGTDFAVSDDAFPEMMDYYRSILSEAEIEYAIFGHIGDNHVHVNMIPRNSEELRKAKDIYVQFATKAVQLGGTVSAEHGIGKLKKQVLKILYSSEEIEKLLEIKCGFDPEGLLCPGNQIECKNP